MVTNSWKKTAVQNFFCSQMLKHAQCFSKQKPKPPWECEVMAEYTALSLYWNETFFFFFTCSSSCLYWFLVTRWVLPQRFTFRIDRSIFSSNSQSLAVTFLLLLYWEHVQFVFLFLCFTPWRTLTSCVGSSRKNEGGGETHKQKQQRDLHKKSTR